MASFGAASGGERIFAVPSAKPSGPARMNTEGLIYFEKLLKGLREQPRQLLDASCHTASYFNSIMRFVVIRSPAFSL